ncbi:MAG: UDP-3-O-(3-hydroxymyristoyl)glucosamine N-acyltransferase [Alphaproteobacteria bacterium]
MADTRFFSVAGPFTLEALAEAADANLADGVDGTAPISDIAPLETAAAEHISFLDNRRYVAAFEVSGAGACIVDPSLADRAPAGMALVLSDQPYMAFARVARMFYPTPSVEPGMSPLADVAADANIGKGCRIDAGAVIGAGSQLGARCHVGPNAVVGDGVVLGDDCRIGAGASLSHCLIGDRVMIYPGARIGENGFGFASGPGGHLRIPQTGRVIVHDDVEIGANSTVDRGSGPDTVIGAGCMIDNLVQIGHNVQMGRGCVIVAQVGISGSTKLDDFVVIGGQAGVAGHLTVGKGARIGAQSGVMRDVEAGASLVGAPAMPSKAFFRQLTALRRLSNKGVKK